LRPFARDRTRRAMSGATPSAGRFSRGDSPSRVNDEQARLPSRDFGVLPTRRGIPATVLPRTREPAHVRRYLELCLSAKTDTMGRATTARPRRFSLTHTRQLRLRRLPACASIPLSVTALGAWGCVLRSRSNGLSHAPSINSGTRASKKGYPDLTVGSVDSIRLPEEIAQCWKRGFKPVGLPARRCGNGVFTNREDTAGAAHRRPRKVDGGLQRVEVDAAAEPPRRGQVQSLPKKGGTGFRGFLTKTPKLRRNNKKALLCRLLPQLFLNSRDTLHWKYEITF